MPADGVVLSATNLSVDESLLTGESVPVRKSSTAEAGPLPSPGGDDMYLDPDVGMAIPGGSTFTLELHYNNRTGRASPDRSGVEVCVTPNRPSKVAGLSWVGTDAISGTSAVGTCRPTSNQTAKIIAM